MNNDSSMESRFFSYSDNVRIHYRVGGNGPLPVVFLHGFAASHATWSDIARLFPAERYRLFFLDLKGFGMSSKAKDGAYSVEDQAAMVRAFIRNQRLPAVVLAGHSLGGAVALRVCMERRQGGEPFTVRKLILIDCAAYPQKLPKFFRRLRSPLLGPLLLHLIPVRMMVRDTLAKVFRDPGAITPEIIERYTRYFRGRGIPHVLRMTVKAINPDEYARIGEEYGKIAVPALIIWGERDRIIRPENGLRLHGDLPGSQLRVIGECGHNPHEERPAETFAVMHAFLSSGAGEL